MNPADREKMVNLLLTFSQTGSVLSYDERRNYAEMIVEVFELKAKCRL